MATTKAEDVKQRGTHVDAQGHEVVWIEEVVRDWLGQVEGQLDELEGRAGIGGGEDDSASVVHHGYICRQDHLETEKHQSRAGVRDDGRLLDSFVCLFFYNLWHWSHTKHQSNLETWGNVLILDVD